MTTDAKQIEPALSAEDWEFVTHRRIHAFIQATDDLPEHLRPEAWRREPHGGTLAIANAQLPDDSPYKITRKDLEALAVIATYWEHPDGDPTVHLYDVTGTRQRAQSLAAKLAALLPPE